MRVWSGSPFVLGHGSTRLVAGVALLLIVIAAGSCAPKVVAPPAPGAPQFPEFIFPAVPPDLGTPAVMEQHTAGWRWLQAGEVRAADRSFTAALKLTKGFYPAEAGLGYTSLAKKDAGAALVHFERALAANPRYAPALAGRGDALQAAGKRDAAIESLEAAIAADPALSSLSSRVQVLRFRGLQDDVDGARKLAEARRWPEARQAYQRAIAASPDSAFLYRELATAERDAGDLQAALGHARQAAAMDPGDARSLLLTGEILEASGAAAAALEAFAAAHALEPSPALEARIGALRARAALAAMPAEYQAIPDSPSLTRAQLAALLGVRLDALLGRTARRAAVVMTDTRDNWAAPWILTVTRAGVMEVYANHTFQPAASVRRVDLALAASKVLALVAVERPQSAASWKKAAPARFADLPPGNMSYPAVSLVVAAAVMGPAGDGTFQATRAATGAEAVAAVARLAELASSRAR